MRKLKSKVFIILAVCMTFLIGLSGGAMIYGGMTGKVYAANIKSVKINKTNFPDDNFRKIISGPSYDRDGNGTLDKEEIGLTLKRPRFKGNTSSLTGAERGTAIHTFFQYCSFEHASTDPEKEIENMKEKGHINEAEASSISINNVRAFFKNHLYKRILSSENYIREKKFMVAVSELNISGEVIDKLKRKESMIKGIIDLMFEENGEIVIVDYKSDRGADEKALRERYRPQLLLYKAAVELTTGKKVKETLLYSFELRKAIPVKV